MILAQSSRRRSAIAVALAITTWVVAMLPLGPAQAAPPNGYPVTNVNLRAGPGTDYPVIVTVLARAPISILGCLADYAWCDTIFEGNRGWMRSIYLSGYYQGYYYSLRDYAPRLSYRTVSFDINGYWNTNYRDRPFYGERARWTGPREEGYVDTAVFYDRLSPYGDWTWLQGQYVWVPSRVDQSWRPYTQGRWVYTDRGWTWVSNEPFGWATYHYGRWGFSKQVGWFWVPGRRWAPAWVSWRSSDDYLAWAPLPPAPDEGVSIDVTVTTPVPDYYWQVVPSHEFQSDDLSERIVRDRDRSRPIIERTRPLGNVTVNNNNVIVNNNVTVNYVEEKTEQKVVTRRIARGKDPKGGSKVEAEAVEIFQPAAEEKPKDVAPPKPKKIEEVAKQSQTKEQAGGEAATDEMLVPAEIKKATGETEAKPAAGEAPKQGEPATTPLPAKPLAPSLPAGKEVSAPPPDGGAPAGEPIPAEQATPPAIETPPPASGEQVSPPAQGKEALPPPPSQGAAPPPAEDEGAPAGTKEGGPKLKNGKGDKSKQGEPQSMEPKAPPPPPPVEEPAPPPPPVDQVAPPPPPLPPVGKAVPQLSLPAGEAAPPPPPPVAPPLEDSGASKAKKQGRPKNEEVQPEEVPSMEPFAPQAPPAPSAEDVGPPTAMKQGKPKKEETQPEEMEPPAPPPPPPAEDAGPPKAKNKGKPKQGEEAPPEEAPSMGPPPSSEPPPPAAEGGAPNGKKGAPKAEPCPEGTMLLEDGSCAPPLQ
ncbi:MAG TPA: DUF6600 domain-containing protein [Methyloceanibacter sp.]|nr:DUF6600 domain-containing protein [Methyloceanibacter sp.]